MKERRGRPSSGLIAEVRSAERYLGALAQFLRRPIGPAEARARVETMLRRREQSFIELLERGIFAPGGVRPYRVMLHQAGFDLPAVADAVRRDGVETTLERLHDAGVHLSLDEFKGRRPIVRPGLELEARPRDFDNPLARHHFVAQTGGSASAPRRILIDLNEVAHEAAHLQLLLGRLALGEVAHAAWLPPPPAVGGIKWALRDAKAGQVPDQWFSQRPTRLRHGELGFALFMASTHATALLLGTRLPWPRHTPAAQAARIAEWLGTHARRGHPAMLSSYPSSAVRVCHAAMDGGIDISGTVMWITGEPLTPAKHAAITGAGARAACSYFMTEAGQLGTPCTDTGPADDVHLLGERVAVRALDHEVSPGRVASAIVVTTVARSSPKILLNVESGDHGVLEHARCGCPLGTLGLAQHLHTIRSYEKLVAEGMSFLGDELVEVLEEVLPARFGGGPTDYQLVEHEENGLTRVQLLVHPRIGPVDGRAVAETAISALAAGGTAHPMMAEIWRASETLQVVRREPHLTPAGKVQPLHRES